MPQSSDSVIPHEPKPCKNFCSSARRGQEEFCSNCAWSRADHVEKVRAETRVMETGIVEAQVEVPIPRELLLLVLRHVGLKVPDKAKLEVDNEQEHDSRNAAEIGPDGPLRVKWTVEIDVGKIVLDTMGRRG